MILSVIYLIISMVFTGIGGGFLILTHNTINKINYKPLAKPKEQKKEEQKLGEILLDIDDSRLLTDPMVLNVLIFGIDKNSYDSLGRSDSIILMSIDSRNKKLKLTSFMRDIWVEIPGGESFDKLNHAYAIGQESLAKETIEKNFGIKIDKYISMDFTGFKDIIRIVGGINMYLTAEEVSYINEWSRDNNYIEVSDGIKHLSDLQALCHVRNRTLFKKNSDNPEGEKLSDDYARASRQRDFFRTIFENFKSCNLGQVLSIISEVGPKVTTNFKKSELLKLLPKSLTYLAYPIYGYALPETEDCLDTVKKGMYVLEVQDMKRLKYKLARFIYENSVKERPDILEGKFKKRYIAKNDYAKFPQKIEKRKIEEENNELEENLNIQREVPYPYLSPKVKEETERSPSSSEEEEINPQKSPAKQPYFSSNQRIRNYVNQ